MTREEAITMLEQHIARLEIAQGDAQLDPNEQEWQLLQDAKEETKELLQRVKAGDEAAIQEVSDLLEMGWKVAILHLLSLLLLERIWRNLDTVRHHENQRTTGHMGRCLQCCFDGSAGW